MTAFEKLRDALPPDMSPQEVEMARTAQRCIMEALDHSRAAFIKLTAKNGRHPEVQLPPASLKLIGQLLGAMSEGRAVTVVPANQELSTVEAANFLNVSRPFVIKQMEEGRLPFRKVGTHRRIAIQDLMAYAGEMRQLQEHALDKLAENARDLGLDY